MRVPGPRGCSSGLTGGLESGQEPGPYPPTRALPRGIEKAAGPTDKITEALRQIETFRCMIEEFKISLFAQEIGTAMPVSPKRLDQQLEIIRNTA